MDSDRTPPTSHAPPSASVNRRGFFRQLLLRGLEQAESTGRGVGQRVQSGLSAARGAVTRGQQQTANTDAPLPLTILRPPGALAEDDFAAACSRCGLCVDACPAQCIRMDPPSDAGAGEETSTRRDLPHIIARESPCVICSELACMNVCPTGALRLVDRVTDIHMGIARLDPQRCLRSSSAAALHPGDRECRVCVNQCPIGAAALAIDADGRLNVGPGCTGCGVCERACPTEPASIVVVAAAPPCRDGAPASCD